MKTTKKLMSLAVAAAVAAQSVAVQAAGFQLMEQNASGLGNAYAGQAAAAENASTIFWNPAGMTRIPGAQASGAVNFILPSSKFTNTGSAPPTPLLALGGTGGDAGDLGVIPNGYFSWQINPQWWVGLGVTVPFGLKTEYDQGWMGRFQGRMGAIKTIDINPSVAFKLSDAVSIGGGISYQRAEVKYQRSVGLGAAAEGRANLKVDDDNFGWNIGALFNLGQTTRIGITYRSAIEHDLEGTLTVTSPAGAVIGAPNTRLTAKLPDTVSWGIAHQISPQWELLGDLTWTHWSTIKMPVLIAVTPSALGATGATLDAFNFQFKDSWRVGVGANWNWRSDVMLKFGIAYDKTPVSDQFRTVFLPDEDRTWLSIGAKYRLSKQSTLDVGYAHIFINDPSIALRRNAEVPPRGNVVGNYDSSVNIISAQFSYNF